MKTRFFLFLTVLIVAGIFSRGPLAQAQKAPQETMPEETTAPETAPEETAGVDFSRLRDEAQAFEREEKWDEAGAAYRQLTEKFPGEALSWFLTGRFLTARGLYREAVDAFERGLEIDPESEAAHLYLARLSIELGDPVLSSEHSAKVLEIQQQAQRAVPVTPPAEETVS